jgi:hypothetical protein
MDDLGGGGGEDGGGGMLFLFACHCWWVSNRVDCSLGGDYD